MAGGIKGDDSDLRCEAMIGAIMPADKPDPGLPEQSTPPSPHLLGIDYDEKLTFRHNLAAATGGSPDVYGEIISARCHGVVFAEDIPPNQFTILRWLSERDPQGLSQRTLADLIGIQACQCRSRQEPFDLLGA